MSLFKTLTGAGKMTQWLSALVAVPEDLDSTPRTHMTTHTICNSSPKRYDALF